MLAATTVYSYTVRDQLSSVLDAAGHQTQIAYDLLGQKTALSDPDLGSWTYRYDTSGNLIRQTDGRAPARTLCFYYDGYQRLTGKLYQTADPNCPATAPVHLDVVYTYDEGANGLGQRTGMTDASGSTAWTYDARGRVSAGVKTLAGVPFTTRYTYRADDQVQSTTYPEGEVVSMGYNSRGLVESLSGSRPYLSAAAYNPGGQPLRLSYGNGVTTQYTYDPQTARLSSLTVPGVLALGYGYEPNGNLAQVDDAGEGSPPSLTTISTG